MFSGLFSLGGVKYIDYKITVTCDAGLVAETDQQRWEQDLLSREGDPVDDFLGSSAHTWDFTAGAGTKSVKVRRTIPTTGPATEGSTEELFQALRFRVTSGPVTSAWTAYELTPPRSVQR